MEPKTRDDYKLTKEYEKLHVGSYLQSKNACMLLVLSFEIYSLRKCTNMNLRN